MFALLLLAPPSVAGSRQLVSAQATGHIRLGSVGNGSPHWKAAEVRAFTGRLTGELPNISSHLFFVFSSCFFGSISFLPIHIFPQDFRFHQLNTINDDFYLLIQTLCFHLSHQTPQPKTLTTDHYLCLDYFLVHGDRVVTTGKGRKGAREATNQNTKSYGFTKDFACQHTT